MNRFTINHSAHFNSNTTRWSRIISHQQTPLTSLLISAHHTKYFQSTLKKPKIPSERLTQVIEEEKKRPKGILGKLKQRMYSKKKIVEETTAEDIDESILDELHEQPSTASNIDRKSKKNKNKNQNNNNKTKNTNTNKNKNKKIDPNSTARVKLKAGTINTISNSSNNTGVKNVSKRQKQMQMIMDENAEKANGWNGVFFRCRKLLDYNPMGIFYAMNMTTMANTCTGAVFFLGWLYLSNGDYIELPICLLFGWLVVRLFSESIPLPGINRLYCQFSEYLQSAKMYPHLKYCMFSRRLPNPNAQSMYAMVEQHSNSKERSKLTNEEDLKKESLYFRYRDWKTKRSGFIEYGLAYDIAENVVMIGTIPISVLIFYQMGFDNEWLHNIIESNFTYTANPDVMNKLGLDGGGSGIGGIGIEMQTTKEYIESLKNLSQSGGGDVNTKGDNVNTAAATATVSEIGTANVGSVASDAVEEIRDITQSRLGPPKSRALTILSKNEWIVNCFTSYVVASYCVRLTGPFVFRYASLPRAEKRYGPPSGVYN